MSMPDMRARKRIRITADEEERIRRGYKIDPFYQVRGKEAQCQLLGEKGVFGLLTYEHCGSVTTVNFGPWKDEHTGEQLPGFTLCKACRTWLTPKEADTHTNAVDGDGEPNPSKCRKNGRPDDVVRVIALYSETAHDVVTIRVPRSADGDEPENFAPTLRYAFAQAIALQLDLEESEIGGFVMPDPKNHCQSIVIYERSEGGTGIL